MRLMIAGGQYLVNTFFLPVSQKANREESVKFT